MSGFNFNAYVRYYEILQFIGKNKTRKQFKNFLRVLYGKKIDRGYIKLKVEKQIQHNLNNKNNLVSIFSKYFSSLNSNFFY